MRTAFVLVVVYFARFVNRTFPVPGDDTLWFDSFWLFVALVLAIWQDVKEIRK
jgi:hypothetical protein